MDEARVFELEPGLSNRPVFRAAFPSDNSGTDGPVPLASEWF